jgi:hypothetical protein
MSTEDPDAKADFGAKSVLGIVATVGGGLLLALIEGGSGVAFDVFLILLAWVVFRFTRWGNPWVAAGVVTATLVVWELVH